ncbi:glutathione S-transferase domain-containing protein [Vibrio sinaloensis DSM 21326]|uniref:Glutathione S-transferase domain-containing protein n=1 Tax=Vibrio sinaloensis DSM 21326 TaxID=945550 RepID=E8M6N3_PHOS4|nr:glutathione S-transferase [Vibrio sinaloensis]EGA70351.1 glutathione S-transferase domain-containing protein [Vibrio sinaloensis DSM 21326]
MKIYQTAMTPSCRRVSLFLNELGIEVPRIEINVKEGDNLTEEFKAKAVNGRVPLLELDDGSTICESVAICRYFDEIAFNDKSLFGITTKEKADVEMWHRIIEFQGLYTGFQAFRNLTSIYDDRETCVYEWGAESKNRVREFLPQLDERLANSGYVASERFTIVDITAYIFVGFAQNGLEIEVLEQYPNIRRWFELVSSRPAFQ